jgi:hypothetical protein
VNKPYENDREASAAARAAVPPEPGHAILSQEQHSELLHRAFAESGVQTSDFEDRSLWWLANYEDYLTAMIARWVRAAYENGKAAGPDGAVTEWALAYTHTPNPASGLPPRREVQPYPDEQSARAAVAAVRAEAPEDEPGLMCREVGPWTPVAGEEGSSG